MCNCKHCVDILEHYLSQLMNIKAVTCNLNVFHPLLYINRLIN